MNQLHPRMKEHVERMKEQKIVKMDMIVEAIKENPSMSNTELGALVELSVGTVSKYKSELRKLGRI